MKVYHGTTQAAWERIKGEGLTAGFFASDPAFALFWAGVDSVVLEVDQSAKLKSRGTRSEPGLECSAYELIEGEVIPPFEFRCVPEAELAEHRAYVERLRARCT